MLGVKIIWYTLGYKERGEKMYIELKTERLILRHYGLSDFDDVHEYAGDKDDIKYMLFLPNETEEDTREFLRDVESEWAKDEPDYYEFGLILDGKLIGGVGLYMEDNRTKAELGWTLNKRFRGKGYVTEAAKAIMKYAIDEFHVTEIFAHCDTRNIPSARVMERLGMELESEGDRHYDRTGEDAREYKYSIHICI